MHLFSLFSGVGGLERKILCEDIKLVGLSEIDVNASSVLAYHHPNVNNFGDIAEIRPKKLPDFDILTGGFPCVNISTQGNQKGFSEGSKSSLFFYMLPIIKEKKPKFVIIENVKNLMSKQMSKEYETIIKEVRSLGYKTATKVIDSSQYGTPQQRVRVVIFGVRKDVKQIGKSNCNDVFDKDTKVKGFKGLDDNCHYISWSKSTRKNHIDFRIREDGKINTLTTGDGCKGASTGTIVINSNGSIRNLTVNECEALMTWPKDFTKYGIKNGKKVILSDAKRYRMCGNGVASNIMTPFRDIILSSEV